MDMSRIVRETMTDGSGWVRVISSNPIDGFKDLGYIRRSDNGTWRATPVKDAEWYALDGALTDREAIIWLMGIRFARCANEAMQSEFVKLQSYIPE